MPILNAANTAASDLSKVKEFLLPLLNKAYASGLKAANQYLIASEVVRGIEGESVAEALLEHHNDDIADIKLVLKRIIELEGEPILTWEGIEAYAPAYRSPSDPSVVEIVKQTLETEAEAIELYNQVIKISRDGGDFVTEQLFTHLLFGEVAQERIFQNFLEDLTK